MERSDDFSKRFSSCGEIVVSGEQGKELNNRWFLLLYDN